MPAKVKVPDEVWQYLRPANPASAKHHAALFLREMAARGWRMMPVEATEDMRQAGYQFAQPTDIWRAMLTVAPELEV